MYKPRTSERMQEVPKKKAVFEAFSVVINQTMNEVSKFRQGQNYDVVPLDLSCLVVQCSSLPHQLHLVLAQYQ